MHSASMPPFLRLSSKVRLGHSLAAAQTDERSIELHEDHAVNQLRPGQGMTVRKPEHLGAGREEYLRAGPRLLSLPTHWSSNILLPPKVPNSFFFLL